MSTIEIKKNTILENLSNIRNDLLQTIKNLPEDKQDLKVSSHDNSWTILDTIKHIYDSEDSMTKLMKVIQEGGEGVPENFDLNRWNRRIVEKMSEKSLDVLLDDLRESRERLKTFLEQLKEEDFNKKGRHGSKRILTIDQILDLIGSHEKSHLDKIKSSL